MATKQQIERMIEQVINQKGNPLRIQHHSTITGEWKDFNWWNDIFYAGSQYRVVRYCEILGEWNPVAE